MKKALIVLLWVLLALLTGGTALATNDGNSVTLVEVVNREMEEAA